MIQAVAPPNASLPFAFVEPVLTSWFAFANSSGTARPWVRDPTTAIFDPVTSSWHVFSTTMVASGGGYPGAIRHFALNSTTLEAGPASGQWSD